MSSFPAVAKLRQRLADESQIIICPGIYDGFTARIALQEGFDALYMVCIYYLPNQTVLLRLCAKIPFSLQTGAGTTASRLGQLDLGVVTLNEMRGNTEMIANLDPTDRPFLDSREPSN